MKSNFVVTTALALVFAGRTKALLERTKKISDILNENFTIITTNYNKNYYKVYNEYIERDLVNSTTEFINIYDYLANRDYKYEKEFSYDPLIKGYQIHEVEKNKIYRYYMNGEYQLYRKYDKETGILLFEDIMDVYTNKRKERLEYNDFGYCIRKILYKPNTTTKATEIYFNDKGKVYLEKWFKSEEKILSKIILFEEKIIEFKTEKEFIEYMFNQILTENSRTFCDVRLLDKPLLNSKVRTKKIFVLHNAHTIEGKPVASYQYLFENDDKADKIIVLTEVQATEIIELGVNKEKVQVIPHAVEPSSVDSNIGETIRKKEILFVGRLVPQKQVDHIIKAFHLIHKEHNDWKLSIYGGGSEEESLQKLIVSYELNEKVHLYGYTNDVKQLYKKASFSVLASKYEGFGLVIMESIHEGCPVLAYNLKFGPKDIIEVNKNGLIVEQNNIEALAQGMKEMILNPLKNVRLNEHFYWEQSLEKWRQVLYK